MVSWPSPPRNGVSEVHGIEHREKCPGVVGGCRRPLATTATIRCFPACIRRPLPRDDDKTRCLPMCSPHPGCRRGQPVIASSSRRGAIPTGLLSRRFTDGVASTTGCSHAATWTMQAARQRARPASRCSYFVCVPASNPHVRVRWPGRSRSWRGFPSPSRAPPGLPAQPT